MEVCMISWSNEGDVGKATETTCWRPSSDTLPLGLLACLQLLCTRANGAAAGWQSSALARSLLGGSMVTLEASSHS